MPAYRVTDPVSGKTLRLTGDSPPTEEELNEIFGSFGGAELTPQAPVAPVEKPPTFMESLKSMPVIDEPGVGMGEVTGAAPKAIAGQLAPHLPMAGMVAGQFAARGNPIGGILGYAAGKQAQPLAEAYGKDEPMPGGLEMGRKAIMEDMPEGTIAHAVGVGGTKAIEVLVKGAGAVIKPIWGRLMGIGKGGVDEFIKAGETVSLKNPLKSASDFDRALRGEITQEDVTQNALEAMKRIRDARGRAYTQDLEKIKANPAFLNQAANRVKEKMYKLVGSDDYDIAITQAAPGGPLEIDFSKSVIVENQGPVRKTIEDVMTWQDTTAKGLDVLKKRLSKYIEQTPVNQNTPAKAFITSVKTELDDWLKRTVPGYAKMTKDYAEASTMIQDLEAGLMLRKQGMTGRIVPDQVIRRLISSMRDNHVLRRELVQELGFRGGADIAGQVAGAAARSPIPMGLAGTGPAMAGSAALAHFVDPAFWPVLFASSPRLSAEFLRLYGKGIKETPGLYEAGVKFLSYLEAENLHKE
jgi:hypothetical protein